MITTDSTADFSADLISRYNFQVIPLTIRLGEDSFYDGDHFTPDDMYARYHEDGTLPQTASPSIEEFQNFFERFTSEGYAVIHMDILTDHKLSYKTAPKR